MARDIGPKIGIDGEKEYRQQIQQIIQQAKTLDAEMKALTASFGKETTAEEKSAKTTKLLTAQIENQQKRVSALRDMVARSTEATGENSKETLQWREALANAEAELAQLQRQLDGTENEVRDLSRAENESGKAANDASRGNGGFGDTLKALLASGAISGIVSGLKQLATEMAGFVKDAVLSYGELEQAMGGSETVFGEYATAIQENAKSAWETMGASEAAYLASANKIGALLQGSGMDAAKSYETTVRVMQRAADVASVMGVDMQSALDAVTGAAKGNYSMMDNLGVKMDEATLKAYALEQGETAVWEKLSDTSKAEYAMSYFLEQTQQYAGNFATEAQSTVAGSIDAVKASVANWIAGLGDSEADIVALTGNMFNAFSTAADNILPIVGNITGNVAESAKLALGEVDKFLGDWGAAVSQSLDEKIAAIGAGFEAIQTTLADIVSAATAALSGLVDAALNWGGDMIQNFLNGIKQSWNDLTDTLNSWAQTVADFLHFSEPDKGPLSNFHTWAPDMMKLFSQGVADNAWRVTDAVTEAFDISPIIEGGMGSTTNFGGVTLNVYSNGPVDGDSLYETFVHRLQLDTLDREAVFA